MDEIKYKAQTIGTHVRGKHKTDIIIELLENALGKTCPYCSTILTLDNASLDHKEPRASINKESKSQVLYINDKDNLQITCEKCNKLKGSFTDSQFKRLSAFCDVNPDIMTKLISRLLKSNLIYRKRSY